MADIKPLTIDTVSGTTGTLNLTSSNSKFGGFDLNCDGTNIGTLIVRDSDATGRILVKTSTKVGKIAFGPIPCSRTIYYSISGTNASAFLYEWY